MDALKHAQHYSARNYHGETASVWHRVPVARRALVFILLFLGSLGELRVVLTKRLSQLRNFPGHISLPGGKADTGLELPWMVARREMSEEIGLSDSDAELQREYGVVIERITELPCYLSRTFSAVKPVVGFLKIESMSNSEGSRGGPGTALGLDAMSYASGGTGVDLSGCNAPATGGSGSTPDCTTIGTSFDFAHTTLGVSSGACSSSSTSPNGSNANTEGPSCTTADTEVDTAFLRLKLRVNPGECSSIFLCPLRDFLHPLSDYPPQEALGRTHQPLKWGGLPWNLRSYTFPQKNNGEVHWLRGYDDISATESEDSASELEEKPERRQADCGENQTPQAERPTKKPKKDLSGWGKLGSRRDSVSNEKIYDVWGLTANILHDLAEVTYLPQNCSSQHGEEELIWSVWHHGQQMRLKERTPTEAALIRAGPEDLVSFSNLMPRTEFNRLKRVYKN